MHLKEAVMAKLKNPKATTVKLEKILNSIKCFGVEMI